MHDIMKKRFKSGIQIIVLFFCLICKSINVYGFGVQYSFTAKAEVGGTGNGKVYVGKNSNTPNASDYGTSKSSNLSDRAFGEVSQDFYYFAKPNDHYDFYCWARSNDKNAAINGAQQNGYKITISGKSSSEANQTVTLYAFFNPHIYSITYKLNNGSWSGSNPSGSYTIESTGTLPAPTRDYYTFSGWKVTNGANDAWSGSSTYNTSTSFTGKYGDVELTAQWSAIEYNISFNANGGTIPVPYSSNKYSTETTGTLPSATRPGYDFDGWTASVGNGTAWNNGETYPATTSFAGKYGDVSFTAKWTPINYTITYDLDGGSWPSSAPSSTYTIESEETLPTPTRTGYTFNNWKATVGAGTGWTNNQTYNAGTSLSGKYGNVTLTAQWTPNILTINTHGLGTDNAIFTVSKASPAVSYTVSANDGQPATIKYIPAGTYAISVNGWSYGHSQKSGNPTEATVPDNTSVTFEFNDDSVTKKHAESSTTKQINP